MRILKNKKGVSEVIGYILLIAIVISISLVVYVWLKTYVPQQSPTCPDGVSISVSDYNYNCTTQSFNFTLENDGTFSIAGYFIHATNSSTQQLAVLDLSPYYTGNGQVLGNSVIFSPQDLNSFAPGIINANNSFDLTINPSFIGNITSIEITPVRYVEDNGQSRFTSCGDERLDIPIQCTQ